MVILEFSIFPLDKGESVSKFVARCLDIVDHSGLDYRAHAMGTLVEGDLDQVLEVVKRCFEALADDCQRIECSMKLDYRKGRRGGLEGKVASVEQKLGRPIKQ